MNDLTRNELEAVLDVLRSAPLVRDRQGALSVHALDVDTATRKLEAREIYMRASVAA